MEQCIYKIGWHNWSQSELTWKQDKQIAGLFNRLRDIADPDDDLQFSADEVIKLLGKYDLLKVFLRIVLRPVRDWRFWICLGLGPLAVNKLTNSQISEIANDFFLCNMKFVSKLSGLEKVLGLISKAANKTTKKTSRSTMTAPTSE